MDTVKIDQSNIGEHVTNLGKILVDTTKREMIEGILLSYSKLDKPSIMNRGSVLLEDISSIIGTESSLLLGNILDVIGNESNALINLCGDKNGKIALQEIHAKHSPIFAGFKSQLVDDWFRLSWSTSIEIETAEPLLKLRMFKRGGENVVIESTLSGWLGLSSHVFEQLSKAITKTDIKADENYLKSIDDLKDKLDIIKENMTKKS